MSEDHIKQVEGTKQGTLGLRDRPLETGLQRRLEQLQGEGSQSAQETLGKMQKKRVCFSQNLFKFSHLN